jgi:hypothetical protein
VKKIDPGQMITILANIGVIAGIVFLGFELRQNTLAQRSAAYQEISRDVQRVTSTIPNATRGKLRRGKELNYVERVRIAPVVRGNHAGL